jgi:short-subunit dehydrogenase involved in D-alanine esterification of teichoic acids
MKLTENTFFITGGGTGIGRGLGEALHKLGNKVIISGRSKEHLDATTKANPGMDSVELDISDPARVKLLRSLWPKKRAWRDPGPRPDRRREAVHAVPRFPVSYR